MVMLASLAGVLFAGWRAAGFIAKHLDVLVSFSAGVFLVFAFGLATETVEHMGSLPHGLGWIFAGAVVVWLAVKLLPALHTHGHGHEHAHNHGLDPRRLMLSDALHNVADGVFLAAAFTAGPVFGFAAAISIFVHEFLQEMAEFFVLRDAGYSVRRALALNFAVSSTILVGAVGGYYLLDLFEMLEAPLLGLAAGGVLVVVLHDLIPHSVRESISTAHYARHVLAFVVGIALMVGVNAALPHQHDEHSHDGHVAGHEDHDH